MENPSDPEVIIRFPMVKVSKTVIGCACAFFFLVLCVSVFVFLSCEITSKTKMIVITEAWVLCEIDLTMFYKYLSCFWSD